MSIIIYINIINNIDDMSFRSGVGLVAWLEKPAGCHHVDKPWDDREGIAPRGKCPLATTI
ncbi:hypothetical protein MCI_03625 [Rickettsia montanensis str. OSU 85-930]|uniref:Uncharacterized protein n=1 Tax=Rickettsia montanensis (strain OSU 85-930) TaxID=1105114 RepID=H8KAJ1_RICMS|nr:hypothetical protein MCI_03625 [Rickettsia montanensis str. OSU 85-930]